MDSLARGRHLLEYWAILRRRRWIVYLGVAAVGLTALVGSFLLTPLYRATATIQIERQSPDILTFRDMSKVDYSFAAYSDFYQTQYKILSSDAVALRAADRADLLSHPKFAQGGGPGLMARIRGMLPGGGPRAPRDPREAAAAAVQARLEITPVRNSHLVQVSWVSPDAELAARVANALTDAYISFNIDSSFTASDQASEFLVTQIGQLKTEIAALEAKLQSYGESKRIVSVDDSNNITMRALSDIAQKRTQAQTLLAEKEAAWRAVQSAPADALPETQRSDLIARLKQEHAALEAEYAEMSRVFKEDWPGLQNLRSKLDQTAERLRIETEAITRGVRLAAESDYRKARAEVENLNGLLAGQQDAAQRLKRDAVEFQNLQSDAQKKRETLNALITRQNEMALSTRLKDLDAASSNVKVVDRARPPRAPFRPNKTFNILVGLLLGAALGVAAALVLDYLDSSVQSAADVERAVKLPTLAVVPRHGSPSGSGVGRMRRREGPTPVGDVDLVVHRDRQAGASEAYRELRTSILLSNAGRPPRTIVVTSALPDEGKSATAVNLAVVLAQLGRKVLLVDTDLRRPRLHKTFSMDHTRGMSTFLSGLESDAITLARPTGVDGLFVVPSGPVPPNPSELLNGPRFGEFASTFHDAGFEHIVFDSPPTLSVADPVIIGHMVDAAVLVVRAHRTPKESLRLAVEKFAHSNVRPIGVVLNDVDLDVHGYHHYRYYGRYESAVERADERPARSLGA